MSLENKIKDLQDEISKLKAEKKIIDGGKSYKLPKATVQLRRRCAI
jgi:hypothetical protein